MTVNNAVLTVRDHLSFKIILVATEKIATCIRKLDTRVNVIEIKEGSNPTPAMGMAIINEKVKTGTQAVAIIPIDNTLIPAHFAKPG